jgi:NAD(P)-dependent dehydrogenase (short-subunit alcohol dehydrogenase family)
MKRPEPHAESPRRAWLVGASQGMGRELAALLAGRGWQLHLSARSREALSEFAETIGAHPVAFDATDPAATLEAAKAVFSEQPPELVIMNVGDYRPMPVAHFDPDLFYALNRTNYLAAVNLLAAVIPLMRPHGGQILLNVSAAAYRGLPQAAPYSAPKAATLHMAEALRPELLREGIALRVINPGFVHSRLTAKNPFPMPFILPGDEAARRIAEAIDSDRFEITFPRRLTWTLKLLRCLPYSLYFAIVNRWILRT